MKTLILYYKLVGMLASEKLLLLPGRERIP